MTDVEVRTATGWSALSADSAAPRVLETGLIEVRGLRPSQSVRIGLTDLVADESGYARLRPTSDEHLSGHVGYVPMTLEGSALGELEIVPGKISEAAYQELRSDLQRVWSGLVFDPDGVSSVSAGLPPAREMWRRIDGPVRDIVERPHEQLAVATTIRRLDQVRRTRELQPAVVTAGLRGRPAMTRTLRRSTATPENQLVAATLQLLKSYARLDPTADDVLRRVDRLLREPVFAKSHQHVLRRITWGMRSDPRYRQVLAVFQALNRPELAATEGPGELRLGVPALSRLYEYWTYLQVLIAARARYGQPIGAGFEPLAISLPGRRRRLALPPETTVTFPGPVHVAFEPRITSRGDGWMGVEYVPHPDQDRQQVVARPDIVVFQGGSHPSLTIFDAKYVGRGWVEREAARLHEKYSRMRMNGTPVVRNVMAIHPHHGLEAQWAGYGHLTMAPGQQVIHVPLPTPVGPQDGPGLNHPQDRAAPTPERAHKRREPTPTEDEADGGTVSMVIDQFWMHQVLGDRRIDLGALGAIATGGRPVGVQDIVLPAIPGLFGFGGAAERLGFEVHWADSGERETQISTLLLVVRQRAEDGPVVVVTGDSNLVDRLPPSVQIFDELAGVPALGARRGRAVDG